MSSKGLNFTSHAQAESVIRGQMSKLMGFKRKPRPNLPNDKLPKIYMYSVNPNTSFYWSQAGFPQFTVPKCVPGRDYSEPVVFEGLYSEEVLQGDTTEHNLYNGIEIAYSVLQKGPGIKPSLNRELMGVFLSETNPPLANEVADAKKRLTDYYLRVLQAADAAATSGNIKDINEESRYASTYLRQPRDWSRANVEMIDCPSCFSPVNKHAAIHGGNGGCGAVISWSGCVTSGLRKFDDVPDHLKEKVAKELGIKQKKEVA